MNTNRSRSQYRVTLAAVASIAVLASILTPANASAWCPPVSPKANPAVIASNPGCLFEAKETFTKNEMRTKSLQLKVGEAVWFTASGCSRMGNIELVVVSEGAVVKRAEGFRPSFCFKAPKAGTYVFKVRAASLMGSNNSGSIEACLSHSTCSN